MSLKQIKEDLKCNKNIELSPTSTYISSRKHQVPYFVSLINYEDMHLNLAMLIPDKLQRFESIFFKPCKVHLITRHMSTPGSLIWQLFTSSHDRMFPHCNRVRWSVPLASQG